MSLKKIEKNWMYNYAPRKNLYQSIVWRQTRRQCFISGVHSKNKLCFEGPYRVLHVVPNTGPYLVLQGTPTEGASKDPHCYGALKHPKVLQSTPHKVLGRHPHLLLWDTLSPLLGALELFILWLIGHSGELFSVAGTSWYLISWRIGPSWPECALNDLTQFGIICSVIGWLYVWRDRHIMLSKQTNSHTIHVM